MESVVWRMLRRIVERFMVSVRLMTDFDGGVMVMVRS